MSRHKDLIREIANKILSTKTMFFEDLIEHPFAKVAMSAGELINRTSQRSIKYAKGCVATTKRNDPKNGRWTFSVKCHNLKSKGPYDVRFRLLKDKGSKTQGMLGREIEISCNCNAWKYNGSDFNALDKDYSERQYSNGQAPNIKDPQRRYLICKHVAASIPLFRRFIIPEGFKAPKKITPLLPKQPPKKEVPKTEPHKPILKKQPFVKKQPEVRQQPVRIKPIRPGQSRI